MLKSTTTNQDTFLSWQRHITIGRVTLLIGLLLVLIGAVDRTDLAEIGRTVTLPMAALLGLSIIALSAHEVGIFVWAANFVARHSRGSGLRLFTNLYILSASVTVLFPNDATILLFTPLVWRILHTIRDETWQPQSYLPFLFTIVFGANAASIALITSNPINMIYASHFELAYLRYASLMILPSIASTVVCYFLLYFTFRKAIPTSYQLNIKATDVQVADRPFIVTFLIVAIMFLSYFVLSAFDYDYNISILVNGLLIIWPVLESKKASLQRVFQGLPWDAVLFVVGMFIVVFALTKSGWTQLLDHLLVALTTTSWLQTAVGNSALVTVGTNLINDWPMASLSSVAIGQLQDVSQTVRDLFIYSAVASANLGNKILPMGSLATLIWLGVITRISGIRITWWQFIRVGLIVTPLTSLAAVLTLWLEFMIGW